MQDLFQLLPKILNEFEDSEEIREAVVFAAWRKMAGETLNSHAVPFRLFEKHLIIAVKDKMWKRHLETLSGKMLFKLNGIFRKTVVTFIEFRIDEETVLKHTKSNKSVKISDEDLREIALNEVSPKLRHSADSIKDDNLRYQFLLAAGSCLARKRFLND